jgi:hypothetical protein
MTQERTCTVRRNGRQCKPPIPGGKIFFAAINHPRNLHFDAFNRAFTTYMKELLVEGMAVAKMRSGARLRVEPDGEAFVQSIICKLTQVGPKQYEKGTPLPLASTFAH